MTFIATFIKVCSIKKRRKFNSIISMCLTSNLSQKESAHTRIRKKNTFSFTLSIKE